MANAFLDRVRALREAEQDDAEEERRARLAERRGLIVRAAERVNEVVRHRRANGIPPPGRVRQRSSPFVPKPGPGPGYVELHEVQAGELPRFQLGADE